MYNTILIPIDMAHIEKAAEMIAAAKTQAGADTRFILLNVIDAVPGWAANYMQEEIMQKHRKQAESELSAVGKAESLANPDIQIRAGHSYNTILEVAEEEGAELIIIGSHHPGVGDYFLGSTAAKVVRHADCSVYVIR